MVVFIMFLRGVVPLHHPWSTFRWVLEMLAREDSNNPLLREDEVIG